MNLKQILLTICILLFANLLNIYAQANKERAKKLAQDGMTYINMQNNDKAIIKLKEAIKLDPETLTYPYELALAYYSKENYGKAIQILDSLRHQPKVTDQVFQLLGNCYDYLANRDKAREIYNFGLNSFPKSGRLYMELGIIDMEEDHKKSGLNNWIKGTKVDPNYANLHYRLTKYYYKENHKVMALVSGETFLNLTRNDNKFKEISIMLYDIFQEALCKDDTCTKIFRFVDKKEKNYLYFEVAYEMALNQVAQNLSIQKSISIPDFIELKRLLIETWYSEKYNERYSNELFDFNKKIIESNNYEVYYYWMISAAKHKEFAIWLQTHKNEVQKYSEWLVENHFKFDE